MRTIINISVPVALAKEVEEEVRKGKFASKSEFFRHVLRERELGKELDQQTKRFERGEGILLNSLADLD